MTSELTLRYDTVADLQRDFDDNLRKGRAFVRGASGLAEREFCTVCIEHPEGKPPISVRAEAVWICADPENLGTGVQFVEFDASVKEALRGFARGPDALPPSSGVLRSGAE